MAEELFICTDPNTGKTFKCVASYLNKLNGKDPFGRVLTPEQKAKYGVS
jgi:hypothetical protein